MRDAAALGGFVAGVTATRRLAASGELKRNYRTTGRGDGGERCQHAKGVLGTMGCG
jgi:hypothetical protein